MDPEDIGWVEDTCRKDLQMRDSTWGKQPPWADAHRETEGQLFSARAQGFKSDGKQVQVSSLS